MQIDPAAIICKKAENLTTNLTLSCTLVLLKYNCKNKQIVYLSGDIFSVKRSEKFVHKHFDGVHINLLLQR